MFNVSQEPFQNDFIGTVRMTALKSSVTRRVLLVGLANIALFTISKQAKALQIMRRRRETFKERKLVNRQTQKVGFADTCCNTLALTSL